MKKLELTQKASVLNTINNFVNTKGWVIFLAILVLGLYLRFYHIQYIESFGWDQGRDAWTIRDILQGKFTLLGPRTGVGHMHLGPVYYYLLAPFFYFTNLDPMGSNYFNMLANIINFVLIYFVTRKIFSNYSALFVVLIYAMSHYIISINQVPWNVTMMPGIAALIFYSIYKVYEGDYKWIFVMWTLSGFYWNLHFTAVFLPLINILSLVFVKNKIKALKYSLFSIPLYFVWFSPNIFAALTTNADTGLIRDFFKYYYIGFHFRFLLYRLPDALIQFQSILFFPLFTPLKFILPAIFMICILLERDKKTKILGYLISLWFLVPLIGFTTYGGPLSDYYFLYDVPMVLFILVYLQKKLLQIKPLPFFVILLTFWSFYIYYNTKDLWIKPSTGGLVSQKEDVKKIIANGGKIEYNEGDIRAYLYTVYTSHKPNNH